MLWSDASSEETSTFIPGTLLILRKGRKTAECAIRELAGPGQALPDAGIIFATGLLCAENDLFPNPPVDIDYRNIDLGNKDVMMTDLGTTGDIDDATAAVITAEEFKS